MVRHRGHVLIAAVTALACGIAIAVVVTRGHTVGRAASTTAGRSTSSASTATGRWIGAWTTAPASGELGTAGGRPRTSIRNVAHIGIGGSQARIHLSNEFGHKPLEIGHATIALAAGSGTAGGPTAANSTMRKLVFAGKASVVIPSGGSVVSDPVRLNVPDSSDVLVTTFSPQASGLVTFHPKARQTSYMAEGDHTADSQGSAFTAKTAVWQYLTGVDLRTNDATGSVIALGDSITAGITSTPNADHRWTDDLQNRLRNTKGAPRLTVLNEGIGGNRILTDAKGKFADQGLSALHRLDQAMDQSGATALLVDLGINDILDRSHEDAAHVIAGLRQITSRAHARGLRVVGSTLGPCGGHKSCRSAQQQVREQINQQLRTQHVFDTLVDFDQALRDPANPGYYRPLFDSGDHLHPSDAGYQAMADAFDLSTL
ncbi:GDSL-type esterase/lipase family protein [Streptomyces sp. NRRL F-5126]|uniref:GDSL-type esterase/lipase family protein n=1 Tax=Streptomyces sp. NRRL F-5126 TaxID=1463857 RepID=UPI0004C5547D|nr:GDSL-type esterase/lipase family protein [Streptomyces sp. NRRL F-5126]